MIGMNVYLSSVFYVSLEGHVGIGEFVGKKKVTPHHMHE